MDGLYLTEVNALKHALKKLVFVVTKDEQYYFIWSDFRPKDIRGLEKIR